ncbi:hypothetical protein CJD36_000660 [Flavipsychrobacter stenotrophus]|uniref:Uncharacterized protein n=1 Tax=Flavipsychrobacter stenotrophus TaxID=2077091 RepID=A0A2S7SZE9_9BACT|nr:hypothetical protein CJD36_000660 [Flavipsychrobacter stenotrophus]
MCLWLARPLFASSASASGFVDTIYREQFLQQSEDCQPLRRSQEDYAELSSFYSTLKIRNCQGEANNIMSNKD